jgi:hypothetical protein
MTAHQGMHRIGNKIACLPVMPGFLIKGKASFITSGPDFDFMKEKFSWLRATLAVVIDSATQTL